MQLGVSGTRIWTQDSLAPETSLVLIMKQCLLKCQTQNWKLVDTQ